MPAPATPWYPGGCRGAANSRRGWDYSVWTLIPTPFPASCRSRITRKQVAIFSNILHNCLDSSCEQIQADGFIGRGRKKLASLSGFLAVFARSGSARITVFKSNLIQAGWLHSPGVRLLGMGLPGASLDREAAGRTGSSGFKSPLTRREGGGSQPRRCPAPHHPPYGKRLDANAPNPPQRRKQVKKQ